MALPDEPTSPEVMVRNPQRAELTGRKKNLGPWVDAILQQIDAQLQSMPDKVTTSEARVIHNDQRTRRY